MELIGIIAVTAIALYIGAGLFAFMSMCFLGFDEVNIPAGCVFLILLLADLAIWWFLVGSKIHVRWG